MSKFAEATTVSPEKSRTEIEQTLRRYGAVQFAYGYTGTHAMIGFTFKGKSVRFVLSLPDPNDKQFARSAGGKARTQTQRQQAYDQAISQKWRALCLTIKAKLETVASGISCFESEFLAYLVLPGGVTVGESVLPQLEESYLTGEPPRLLPMLPSGRED